MNTTTITVNLTILVSLYALSAFILVIVSSIKKFFHTMRLREK